MLPERFQKLKKALTARQTDLTVIMDNVHKPHNMAAILRSCEAVGVHRAHLITPEPLHYNKPKSAAGVLRWINLDKHASVAQAYAMAHAQGMQILAAHPGKQASDFREIDFTQPTAIVVGTEREGLSADAIEQADELIVVPMEGLVRSLNVSVTAALILYEAQRQRRQAGLYNQPALDTDTFRHILFEWAYPRIARYCRQQNIPYPAIDEDSGEILDMQAFSDTVRDSRQQHAG